MSRAPLSFGFREALALSVLAIALSAWEQLGQRPVLSHSSGAPRRAKPRYMGSFHRT